MTFGFAHGNDGAHQRDAYPDDHLGNLGRRNHHGRQPLGFAVTRHEAVVKVHNGVDAVVHHHKENAGWTRRHMGMPAMQQDGNVVTPMQKDQLFLVNNDKKGIHQFTVATMQANSGRTRMCVKEWQVSERRQSQQEETSARMR